MLDETRVPTTNRRTRSGPMAQFNRRLQLADRRGNLHDLRAQGLHRFLRLHRVSDAIGAGRSPHRARHGQRLLVSVKE